MTDSQPEPQYKKDALLGIFFYALFNYKKHQRSHLISRFSRMTRYKLLNN